MDRIVYFLCALSSLACAVLLLRAFAHTRFRLLLWSGLCFVGLTFNNLFLVLDRIVFPDIDFSLWRQGTALLSIMLLLAGLILESEQ